MPSTGGLAESLISFLVSSQNVQRAASAALRARLSPMKTLLLMFALMATACALAKAADERPISDDAAYLADLDKRGEAVLNDLKLTDAGRAARVKQAVINQYRAIKQADDAALAGVPKDDKAAIAQAKEIAAAAKKPLHDAFLAKLAADLTPEQ